MKDKALYVVTAIDAEGPINDPRKPDILNSWERVDGLLDRLFARDFRGAVRDSAGGGAVISWFILTLSGFRTNPFNRPMGYHLVYDHYINKYAAMMKAHGDGIYWHYHQPAKSGAANEWCRDWLHTSEYDNILARLLMERSYFPSCFRAGGRVENNDTSAWLEEIIPFDFTCCSGEINWDNIESDGHALREVSDWTQAPADWSWYHPSPDDYQRQGSQRRFVFRCPDLASQVHTLKDDDIRQAFARASGGDATVLAFFEHDRRDVTFDRLADVYLRIDKIGRQYPGTTWRFADAREAAVAATGLEKAAAPSFAIEKQPDGRLLIASRRPIFGHAPFVAAASADGSICRRAGVVTVGQYQWLTDPLPAEITRAGVAAASPSGEVGAGIFDLDR